MSDPTPESWPVSWEENRRAQLEASVRASADQRVAWLEEALKVAAATGALEGRRQQSETRWSKDASVPGRDEG